MNNERPRVTMDLPVSFNINYKEDGTVNIDIDTKLLESTIAEAVVGALTQYTKKKIKKTTIRNVDGNIIGFNEFNESGKPTRKVLYEEYDIIEKYNEQGLRVYYEDADGNIEISEYDENGNEIHVKWYRPQSKDWFEYWNTYDENGNVIHSKDTDGNWLDVKYDLHGNILKEADKNGTREYKYDEYGNKIYSKEDDGTELYYEYEFY